MKFFHATIAAALGLAGATGCSSGERLAGCGDQELRGHVEILEQFDLLKVDLEPFDGPPVFIVGTPTIEWALLHDIRDVAGSDPERIRRILCDLDFSSLDL